MSILFSLLDKIILVRAGIKFGGDGGDVVTEDEDKEAKLTFNDVITGLFYQTSSDHNSEFDRNEFFIETKNLLAR